MKLKRGTQIIYVPTHAENDGTDHPDCERGFVTSSTNTGVAFCRYWSKYSYGDLRTKAGSERTPVENIVICDTVPQSEVDEALEKWCKE